MKRSCKANGGAQVVSGNKNVIEEAKARKDGGAVTERKDGGKVIGRMSGGSVKARLDRPGRKTGGAVGADKSPLSSAHRVTSD